MQKFAIFLLSIAIVIAALLISNSLNKVAEAFPNRMSIQHEGLPQYDKIQVPVQIIEKNGVNSRPSTTRYQNEAKWQRDIYLNEELLLVWPKPGAKPITFKEGTVVFSNELLEVKSLKHSYYYYQPYKWEVKYLTAKKDDGDFIK